MLSRATVASAFRGCGLTGAEAKCAVASRDGGRKELASPPAWRDEQRSGCGDCRSSTITCLEVSLALCGLGSTVSVAT